MRKLKNYLSFLMAIALLLALCPVVGAEETVDSGTCGDHLTWTLDSDGVLTISGTGDIPDTTSTATIPWYDHRRDINRVVIEYGITEIGDWAFDGCSNLTNIQIPDSVTRIGDAFSGCNSLRSVTIPSSVTTVSDYAFMGCSSLSSINVDAGNSSYASRNGVLFDKNMTRLIQYPCAREGAYAVPSGVKIIGGDAFYNCDKLTALTIPSSVTDIEDSAFAYCVEMTELTIAPGLRSIGDVAFFCCEGLTSLTLPDTVTSIGLGAFEHCENLRYINIPSGVTYIGDGAFMVTGLTEVTIPPSVTAIGDETFIMCDLTEVTIPSGVTRIGNEAFSGCESLTRVTIPSSVTYIGDGAFYYCGALTDVYYTGSEQQWRSITIGDSNSDLTSATIHYGLDALPDATRYVYYSVALPGGYRAVANTLPSWLSANGSGSISGVPTRAGTYTFSVTDGTNTLQVSVTVRENGDNNVRDSVPAGYEIIDRIPDLSAYSSQTMVIDDTQTGNAGGESNFDRFLDVYLDGRKLIGGKLEAGEQPQESWEYYAEQGSTKITIRDKTLKNAGNGTHTISATFQSKGTGGSRSKVDSVSQNYTAYVWDADKELQPKIAQEVS